MDQKSSSLALSEMGIDYKILSKREGVELLDKENFDLVIIDISPVQKEETNKIIYNIGSKGDSKIIALSSYSSKEIREVYGDTPFLTFLSKPLIANELALALYRIYKSS